MDALYTYTFVICHRLCGVLYRTKRCCFSKSSPAFEPAMTKNADDLVPAANSPTASSDLAPSAHDDADAEQSERL